MWNRSTQLAKWHPGGDATGTWKRGSRWGNLGKGVETDYVGQKIQEGDRVVLAPGVKGYGAYGFRTEPDNAPYFGGGFGDYIYLNFPNTC